MGSLLPPSGGPTQARTTPRLSFCALLLCGEEFTTLSVVLQPHRHEDSKHEGREEAKVR